MAEVWAADAVPETLAKRAPRCLVTSVSWPMVGLLIFTKTFTSGIFGTATTLFMSAGDAEGNRSYVATEQITHRAGNQLTSIAGACCGSPCPTRPPLGHEEEQSVQQRREPRQCTLSDGNRADVAAILQYESAVEACVGDPSGVPDRNE